MSKVYFSDLYAGAGDNLLKKFERLISASDMDKIDFKNKYVAVKIHFGEMGNLVFLRHQYARVLCDHIKALGGKPFLTDANTLYVGERGNAVDHLACASYNGYNQLTTGVPVIIADGLRGTDERLIPVEGGELVKEAKIGAAVAEADIVISLNHCKGHIEAGFGGALKNLGMGCGSKRGKAEMHSAGTASVSEKLCIGCGRCVKSCANDGVKVVNDRALINSDKCLGCGYCFAYCPTGAIGSKFDIAHDDLSKKIAEYAWAVVNGKPAYHFNFVVDVQSFCDCMAEHSPNLVPDIGMFASSDPVALDQCCFDQINTAPLMPGCLSHNDDIDTDLAYDGDRDLFRVIHPATDFTVCLKHAVKLGLGTSDYEIEEV